MDCEHAFVYYGKQERHCLKCLKVEVVDWIAAEGFWVPFYWKDKVKKYAG